MTLNFRMSISPCARILFIYFIFHSYVGILFVFLEIDRLEVVHGETKQNKQNHEKMKHVVLMATTMAFTMEVAMTNPRPKGQKTYSSSFRMCVGRHTLG